MRDTGFVLNQGCLPATARAPRVYPPPRVLSYRKVGFDLEAPARAPSRIRPIVRPYADPEEDLAFLLAIPSRTARDRAISEALRSVTAALAAAAWVNGADISTFPREGGWYHPSDLFAVRAHLDLAASIPDIWRSLYEWARLLWRTWRDERKARGYAPAEQAHGCTQQLRWAVEHCPHDFGQDAFPGLARTAPAAQQAAA